MRREIEFEVLADGTILAPFDSEGEKLAELLEADIKEVQRASIVEWERARDRCGWTVRAAHDPQLAIRRTSEWTSDIERYCVSKEGMLEYFKTREQAIGMERGFFWALLPPRET